LSNLQSLSALGLNLISMSDVFRTVTARPERTTIKELFMNLDWDLGDDGEKEFRLYYDNGKDFDFDRKGVVMEVILWGAQIPYVIVREGAVVFSCL
ncbi:hypothetical protein BGX33_008535, partial [Mortierella sp. NVP41]